MPSARAAGTPTMVMTTSMLIENVSAAADDPLRRRAAVAQLTTPTTVTTTSMLLKKAGVAGDNPRFGGG
jgi:hypothetical protein